LCVVSCGFVDRIFVAEKERSTKPHEMTRIETMGNPSFSLRNLRINSSPSLLHSNHNDRERAGNGAGAAGSPGSPRRWRRRWWPGLRRHSEQMAGLAVEGDRARAV